MAFPSAGEIAWLLWSDVERSRAEMSAGFGHFVLIQVLKGETERKQELLISPTRPVTVSSLSSSSRNSPFNPT